MTPHPHLLLRDLLDSKGKLGLLLDPRDCLCSSPTHPQSSSPSSAKKHIDACGCRIWTSLLFQPNSMSRMLGELLQSLPHSTSLSSSSSFPLLKEPPSMRSSTKAFISMKTSPPTHLNLLPLKLTPFSSMGSTFPKTKMSLELPHPLFVNVVSEHQKIIYFDRHHSMQSPFSLCRMKVQGSKLL